MAYLLSKLWTHQVSIYILLIIVPIFVPSEYTGISSLITNFAILGFTALLGLYLFVGKLDNDKSVISK